MKKLLFILTIICLIIPSCKKTPVITLSADKTEISANGEDVVKFKVICNDEDDVTKNCRIFFADSKKELGATTFSTTSPKTYSFYATYEDATSNNISVKAIEVVDEGGDENGDENENENEDENEDEDENGDENGDENQGEDDNENETPVEGPITLSASTDTIVADGIDFIEFTVMQDTTDVTNISEIFVNNNPIEGKEFKTTTAGSYVVYAKKNDTIVSNEIKFFAKEVIVVEEEKPIELSASTTTIVANGTDAVTFTVTQEGNDVTSQSNIFVNGNKINGNKFTTYNAGTYTVYAQKNEVQSNEITITAEQAPDLGTTVFFAEGVTLTSGWYDVNKLKQGGSDINMCWAASSANIIQWWQDRYVEAGNTLPAGAVNGAGTKVYDGIASYNLAIMDLYRDLWDNSRGGEVSHGVTWYFEGRNIMKEASAGSHAQPLNDNSGGYFADIWSSQILPNVYHEYDYVIVPEILEYNDLISQEYNNYYNWGNGSGLPNNQRLKKFSDMVVEFMDRGLVSLTVALSANLGSLHHATTLWGYEIDNATGILTKIWITDSDDIHQNGESGDPTQQMLREYAVSFNEATGTIKFSGAPYGACYAVSLYPVSAYGTR